MLLEGNYMKRLVVLLFSVMCVSGCVGYKSAEERKGEVEGDFFMLLGVPAPLLAEGRGARLKVATFVRLSDQLSPDEWEQVMVLIGRVPQSGPEVINVSGPFGENGQKKITVQTNLYKILLMWDSSRNRWKVDSAWLVIAG